MYKTIVFTLTLFAAIVITTLANISYMHGQKLQVQAATQNVESVDNQRAVKGDATGPIDTSNNRYWFWLLPLLALPFLLLVFRTRDEDELDSELWPYDQYSVGVKGGRSSSNPEEEVL